MTFSFLCYLQIKLISFTMIASKEYLHDELWYHISMVASFD